MENVVETSAAPDAPPPSPEASDPADAKRAEAARRQRESRALAKLEKAEKARKKLEKLQRAQQAAPSPADQPATLAPAAPPSPGPSDGWPSKEAQAAMMPGAVQLLGQLRFALGSTRYGAALQPQTVEVTQPDGSKASQTVDPVTDMLAPPLAAVLAQSGANLTPGQALVSAFMFTLGPVALAHGVQLTVEFIERRRKTGAAAAPALPRQVTPAPPAEATPRNGASAPVEFRKRETTA